MRVLILADDCNPEWPSLPIVGYKAARAIAEQAEVVVATHIRNRRNINKEGLGRAAVRYFDTEYVARPMFKIAKWIRGGTTPLGRWQPRSRTPVTLHSNGKSGKPRATNCIIASSI